VACFWGDGVIDNQHVRGLALKSPESSYTLWALWVWIYCIVWWFIQVRPKLDSSMSWRIHQAWTGCGHNAGCASTDCFVGVVVLRAQDACKVVTYWLLRKYDIFQINSANLVNVRGAQTFNENPLARQSAGAVEVRGARCTPL
jgi:H+-transporting ATPase